MAKITSVVLGGASLAAFATQPAFRLFLAKWTGFNAPGGVWRMLALLLALTNIKSLPFVWHFRFFRALLYHLYLQPTPYPPKALFQPIITSTRCSLLEMDWNLHKSNSTYFADMDISRAHHFIALIRNGIRQNSSIFGKHKSAATNGVDPATVPGRYGIILGGVGCSFRREIPPFKKYEMWTRLLSWDRKWFYLVTHLVKPGVGKPSNWSLQPWKKGSGADVDEEKLKGAVYSSAIAKYVVKKGRLTIPPEQVLCDAGMVPKKPEGWVFKGLEEANGALNGHANGSVNGSTEHVLPKPAGDEWNWDVIEAERLRGLKFAESFAQMDGLHEWFDGGKHGALGEFSDLF